MPKYAKNLIGQKFNRLTVVDRANELGAKQVIWRCLCDCGTIHNVRNDGLLRGTIKSCGCFRREYMRKAQKGLDKTGNKTHGHAGKKKSRTYMSWIKMKDRVLNKNHTHFKHYGGRGIAICDRWVNSFEHFLADMGERPKGLTLDRINNDGNYEPGNCRWATYKEQNNNTQRHRDKR